MESKNSKNCDKTNENQIIIDKFKIRAKFNWCKNKDISLN